MFGDLEEETAKMTWLHFRLQRPFTHPPSLELGSELQWPTYINQEPTTSYLAYLKMQAFTLNTK